MWPWRKRSPFESVNLPKKVFISHSYKDAEARERLLRLLPKGVEPIVFPPITVSPEQMISNHLIKAILSCDAVICIEGGASAESFWVSFERDYALRSEKKVYSFFQDSSRLVPNNSPPLHLHIFPAWAASDTPRVRTILDFMKDERNFQPFDLDTLQVDVGADSFLYGTLRKQLERLIAGGGSGVIFWSKASAKSIFVSSVLAAARGINRLFVGKRLLLVRLDDEAYERVLPPQATSLQLFGDSERSERHRIDDLIVNLYWLIYRNTRQNQLS